MSPFFVRVSARSAGKVERFSKKDPGGRRGPPDRHGIIAAVPLRLLALLILELLPQVGERELVLCEQPGWRQEEESLVAALHVYTRDLNLALLTVPDAGVASEQEQMRAAQSRCGPSVVMVIWYGRELGAPTLNALACADRSLRKEPLAPPEDLLLASQTLALKLRGLLAVAGLPSDMPAPPKPADTAKPAPFAEPTSPARPGPKATEPVAVARPAASGPVPVPHPAPGAPDGPAVAVGFLAQSSPDGTWLRPGGLLRGTFPFAKQRLAVVGDVAFLRATEGPPGPPHLTLSELSFTAAIPVRMHAGAHVFEVGPLVGAHVYWANAQAPGGQSDQSVTASWSVGLLAAARAKLTQRWGLFLSLSGRSLFPRQVYTVAGQRRPAIGLFDVGLAVGLSYRWAAREVP